LGNYYNPQRGRVQFSYDSSYVDRSVTVFSQGGQSYSDQLEQTQTYTADWFGLQYSDIEEFKKIFADYGTARPLWVSMDSGEVWSSDRNRRIIFAKFDAAPTWSLVSPDNFTMTMTFREEL